MCNKFETLHANYLDPPEPKVQGYDWQGEEIYVGDEYYDMDGDYVQVDNIEEYLKSTYLTTSTRIAGEQMEDVYLNDDLLDSKLQNVLYANKTIGQIRMKNDSYEVYLYEPQIRKTRVKTYEEVEEILKSVSKSLKEQSQK